MSLFRLLENSASTLACMLCSQPSHFIFVLTVLQGCSHWRHLGAVTPHSFVSPNVIVPKGISFTLKILAAQKLFFPKPKNSGSQTVSDHAPFVNPVFSRRTTVKTPCSRKTNSFDQNLTNHTCFVAVGKGLTQSIKLCWAAIETICHNHCWLLGFAWHYICFREVVLFLVVIAAKYFRSSSLLSWCMCDVLRSTWP